MNLSGKIKPKAENSTADTGNGSYKKRKAKVESLPSILMAVPTPVIYIDKNQHCRFINEAFLKWFDIEKQKILNKPVKDVIGETAYEQIRPYIERALNGEKVHYTEEVAYKQGKRYVEATYVPDMDASGNVKGYVGFLDDITSEKKIEKELLRKNLELQDYVDNATIGLHWVDSNGNILWANKAELDMLGYTAEEYIGQPIAKFHANQENIKDILSRLKRNETLDKYETDLLCKDGSLKTVLISSNVFWEDGKFMHTRCFTTDITERKLSEAFHRTIFDNSPDCYKILDAEGRLHYVNPNGISMIGVKSFDEIKNIYWCDMWDEGNKPRIKDSIQKAIKGETTHFQTCYQSPQGLKWVDIIVAPVKTIDNEVKQIIAVSRDVTSQKTTQEALHESEQRYRNLIHSLPVAIYTCDQQGYITMYNEAAVDLWGRQPEVGKEKWCGSYKIYKPDGVTPLPLDECPMAITLKEGKRVDGTEIIVETHTGKRKHVLPHPQPIFDSHGNLTGAVNMLVDITERKIAEEPLARLAAIVQSTDAAVISKTLEGVVTSWNPGAEKLYGYTEKEMIGQPVTKLMPPDRQDEEKKILEKLRKGERIDHFESKRITKDGRLLDVSLTVSPVKDATGKIIGASKIARNITDQKKLHEQLRKSEERLRMVISATQLGTWEFHPLTKKLIWSDECKHIYGIHTDFEPTSEFVAEHTHPDDRDFVHQEVEKAMNPENSDIFQLQYRIYRDDDKQLRWLKVQGKVFFDKQNKPERFIGIMLDVTKEREEEQLRKESEERFRMAVETTALGTWEYNPVTWKLYCSEESRRICGLPDDHTPDFEVIFDHIYSEDKEYFIQQIKQAINPAGDGTFDMQMRILRYNDKAIRWVRAKGKVFFNSALLPERLIGTMLDITEEKNKEEKLKESVELFQTMADNVPAMIWMSGTDKFNDYFNRTWLEFTGRKIEDEANEGWLDNVHPADVQRCIDTYNHSYKNHEGFYTEYRLRRHDGVYRWIADNSIPRYSSNGEFLGFISACIDIDDQKRFREKIQDSELLFKTISNASPAALWMTDQDGQNVFVNQTWINWTGKSLDQQLLEGWAGSLVEEDKEKTLQKFQQALSQKEYFNAEFRFVKKGGDIRWGLTEGYPYYDINGNFAGYAGSVVDITEMKKLEQRKDDFIKMASHELKTPITSINGYVQLLLNIYKELDNEKLKTSKETVRSSLVTIGKQVSKLTRLVSELLDLSRIESGKLELKKTEFSLADLVEETVQDIRHTTHRHAIIVHNDFEGKIIGDKDRLAQVILNILNNAVKYSPDSDKIEVYTEGNKNEARIRIKDYGIGIDPKDQPRIFERFYRAEGKSEQTYPGFGIGLFIASEIIARHSGKITVKSKKGEGSTFTITMPLNNHP